MKPNTRAHGSTSTPVRLDRVGSWGGTCPRFNLTTAEYYPCPWYYPSTGEILRTPGGNAQVGEKVRFLTGADEEGIFAWERWEKKIITPDRFHLREVKTDVEIKEVTNINGLDKSPGIAGEVPRSKFLAVAPANVFINYQVTIVGVKGQTSNTP
ncbi:hypothetical protein RUM44_009855 [Polyplax serrata]|uniref:Uncharacterized protein n=1 Tax=Polyplax serrata TaxID=468196 RepID=A0ABR1AU63_POLSC